MNCKSFSISLLVTVVMVVLGSAAQAHNLWLNPSDYFPEVGTTVDIGIGWGHKYPANRIDQEVKDGRVEVIQALAPDGKVIDLSKVSPSLYQLKIDQPGAYRITASIKPGFFTTTPEGRKWGNKTEIENPIKCTNFHIQAKTVLIAGNSGKNMGNAVGQRLEVIPLNDLDQLKPGNDLSIQLLFDGKPLADARVRATFAGFKTEDLAPHKASSMEKKGDKKGHHRNFPVETVTDGQGKAALKLQTPGYWMVMLSHRCPYADAGTCDEYMYNMAFTFEVPKSRLNLVSMGVGDADLITLRAIDTIKVSDVIVCRERTREAFAEYFEGKTILDASMAGWRSYRKDCASISDPEKRAECQQKTASRSELINQIRAAVAAGKSVSVLGSGDLMIYGGPYRWYLEEFKDLQPVIIPGVSCFNAANAAMGKDIMSGKASHSAVLTTYREIDKLAGAHPTMIIFTMHTKFGDLVEKLKAHYPAQTPIAIVFHAGYKDKEHIVRGDLDTILAKTEGKQFPFEHLVYVGDFMN